MVRVAFCGISHETNTFATAALGLTARVAQTMGEFGAALDLDQSIQFPISNRKAILSGGASARRA